MADKGPVDRKCAPVPTNAGAKDEIWDAPDVMIGLSDNYGSVRDHAANLRLYDLLKSRTRWPAT